MAFGFPASFTTSVETSGSRDEARTAILGAFQSLGWKYTIKGPDHCEAQVPVNLMSWGETLTVELTGSNQVNITSKCRGIQMFDWGKNRQNVDQFLAHFSQYVTRAAGLGPSRTPAIDKNGRSPVENLIRDNSE